jgi:O-6-methylguanine DNA methyltransferase
MFDAQPQQAPRPPGADFTTALFARIGLDRYTVGSCVLGAVYLGWSARGVSAVRLTAAHGAADEFADWYHERTGRRIVPAVELDTIARAAQAKLADSSAADVPVDLDLATPLERDVFARVREIRAGYARPCELIARELGAGCTPQSVADVLTNNAVPLLIPCHRVVREDRCCGGYVFGDDAQQQLLAAEGLDPSAVDRAIERGYRYIENDGWFCLPTCGSIAVHLDAPGYAGLRSLDEVRARGLRACGSCRPLAA